MDKNYYAVIMAGGGGTRLWPLSTRAMPKQMLKIINGSSLFQIALNRLDPLFSPEQIFVVTVKDQVKELAAQAIALPDANYLIEPLPRGTASVIGLAAVHLLKKDQNAVMAVLTADHIIKNIEQFHMLLKRAYILAQENHLVTLGIHPTVASTGYGYIHAGFPIGMQDAYRVERFIEKPDKQSAEAFLQAGDYYWNSGMFIWRVDQILKEFEKQMPDVYDTLMAIYGHLGTPDEDPFIHQVWPNMEKQTIDYGIMEKARDVVVLPGKDLGWEDVGSWDSMYSLLEADVKGNIIENSHGVLLDCENVLIFGEGPENLTAGIGLNDIVIVKCKQATLVCRKGESQRVKEIIEKLESEGLDAYL